ncbi:SIR2 family protein [Dickeya fangzhongdai]|uniref:SIR2 family protein n=1 Tax=Dickeya TaxID=204037 RepID=UPI00136F1F93|nr:MULTISPECIES: SIR2 family protein [Dickeya]NAT79111.1 SIR2 family protein [Dickeya dadantii]NPE64671.1 SIR2 family protein [Dickeya dadantii]ULR31943.1 SIR2 family protein [Dickeya fangzhongdai]UMB77653.1 SIR2 family protein [Dickeya fangzhongdai]
MISSIHNPDTYMFDFRQIVTNGRKKIGILIGAGAPVSINIGKEGVYEPLIPNIEGLTRYVKNDLSPELLSIFETLEDPPNNNNLEKILSDVRTLADIIGEHKVHGGDSHKYKELESSICRTIKNVVSKILPESQNPYSELISWINGINRSQGVEIFTTNYDLLCEDALERSQTPFFDGFTGSRFAFFDPASISTNDLPPRWVRLWKLHGSIGWMMRPNGQVTRVPECTISNMVYPSHIKYSQTQAAPFSALFDRLKNFIMEPDSLLITTGFSFADAHISSKISECLSANPTSAVIAFQYKTLADESYAVELATKTSNLSVYCKDGAVINTINAPWKTGELPSKNWDIVRKEYLNEENEFILGDFKLLARFLAIAGGGVTNSVLIKEDNVEDKNNE